jgi:hypothetical protein
MTKIVTRIKNRVGAYVNVIEAPSGHSPGDTDYRFKCTGCATTGPGSEKRPALDAAKKHARGCSFESAEG